MDNEKCKEPPIMDLVGWGLINQVVCTSLRDPQEIVDHANKHFHPGTTHGWVWPSDEALKSAYESNIEKMDGVTLEDLRNGVQCEARETHKHYLIHC